MVNQKDPVTKEDLKTFKEEIVHQFRIISEDLRSDVKQVAEGVLNVNERLDKTRQELKEEIDAKTDVISHAVISLDQKVVTLDQKVTSLDQKVVTLDQKVISLDQKVVTLDQKVTSLDQKLDKSRQELKTEIQETRQEVLAAIKFSYAELDRRLTTLEKEFLELKHRVDKMESRSAS